MKRFLLTAALTAAGLGAMSGAPDQSPLWLRNTALSPDGQTIAFTFRGDIYTVPFTGGEARRITTDNAYDTRPVWSPDGKEIVFSSDRMGSQDLYIVDAAGGQPRRLTTHSGGEYPLAFANDTSIIFTGSIMPSQKAINGYVFTQVYTIGKSGGRPQLLMSLPSDALSVDAAGRILYQDKKGYEDKFRKHEQSSGTSDVWLVEGALQGKPVFRQLTRTPYHSLNPQWGNGDEFYFVSETDSTLNVYAADLKGGTPRQLTRFKGNPVRSLSATPAGRMVFSQNGEIYTMASPGSEPQKLKVSITGDNPEIPSRSVSRSSGATRFAVSPSGKEVAVTVRGDIFVTSSEYATTRQVTATSGQERNISFGPNGRFMVYDSERDGRWQLYKAEIGKDDNGFAYATDITETLLPTGEGDAFQPLVSPDGKKVAFLRNRTELCVLDLASGKVTTVMPGKFAYSYVDGDLDYHWHPDSEWILFDGYIGKGGWNNSDVAAISADGKQIINVTESGYSDGNSRWTSDGRGILYSSDRRGYRSHGSWGSQQDVFVMWLDPTAYEKFLRSKEEQELADEAEKNAKKTADKKDGKKDKKDSKKKAAPAPAKQPLDFAHRLDRRLRLTPNSSALGDYWLNPKGDKLYYVAAFEDDGDLWMADLKEGTTKLLVKGWGFGALVPDSAGKKLFTLNRGQVKSFDVASKDVKRISFDARSKYSAPDERDYMFDHMKALVNNKFYDKTLHGVDWEGYTENYARFLPYINNRYDFAELLSEILGELNASHTGGRAGSGMSSLDMTAYLGAFYDENYTGDGLRILEVIDRGPLSTKPEIVPGTVITAIDGEAIPAGTDYFPLLAGKSGRNTRLSVTLPGGEKKTVTVKPISAGGNRQLLRQRWVARNQAMVDSLSGGRVGYVSIEGMNSASYREIYEQALGRYRNCDAIIVDTRYNGGGWLHNDVALLFSGKKYVDYSPRGQYIGSDPFSQWTKPSVMLVNECNYSDAHGTPYTYKTLGIGKLIGAPVPGTMTAVWWETQVDPSIIFGVPQVTSLDRNGKALENQQLNPDIIIYNQPGEVLDGYDAQLKAAVDELLGRRK